jgi:hypothetical protein
VHYVVHDWASSLRGLMDTADDPSKWNAKKPAIDALKNSPMWDRFVPPSSKNVVFRALGACAVRHLRTLHGQCHSGGCAARGASSAAQGTLLCVVVGFTPRACLRHSDLHGVGGQTLKSRFHDGAQYYIGPARELGVRLSSCPASASLPRFRDVWGLCMH